MGDVFERIDAGWHTLLAAVHGVPEDALTAPGAVGVWSVKDVLGHVAFWKSVAADRAERVAGGGPLYLPGDDEDWQVINEREAAARARWPLTRVLDDLHAQHRRALAGFRRVPAEHLEAVMGDYIDHSAEHAAEIRGWRSANGY